MKTFDKLHSEIKDYLAIKVPEMDEVKRLEIAGYILSLFIIREGDVLHERDKEWRHAIRNAEKKNKEARKFTIDKSVDKETLKEEIRDGVESIVEGMRPVEVTIDGLTFNKVKNLIFMFSDADEFEKLCFSVPFDAYALFTELHTRKSAEPCDIKIETQDGFATCVLFYTGKFSKVAFAKNGSVEITLTAWRANPV